MNRNLILHRVEVEANLNELHENLLLYLHDLTNALYNDIVKVIDY